MENSPYMKENKMELLILWTIGWLFCLGFYIDRKWYLLLVILFTWPVELGFALGKLYDKLYDK
jgi:hypothetical protein